MSRFSEKVPNMCDSTTHGAMEFDQNNDGGASLADLGVHGQPKTCHSVRPFFRIDKGVAESCFRSFEDEKFVRSCICGSNAAAPINYGRAA